MVADLTVDAEAAGFALAGDETSRLDPFAGARRVVVKVGSALLVDPAQGLDTAWLEGLAEDVAGLRAEGVEVLLVSSGAIALGRRVLGLSAGPLSLDEAQAAAAVGQIELAHAYTAALGRRGAVAAQVLLTIDDTQERRRYLNALATFKTLLGLGATPIVNENDTVATDEIRYGDNDRLAARAASMVGADRLVLLSDVDGLYTADPRRSPDARRIARVTALTSEVEAMAGGAGTAGAKGGMVTKLAAAKIAVQAGCDMAVAKGAPDAPFERTRPLEALRRGAPATWFVAINTPTAARKQWISGMKPAGRLVIDAGAAQALAAGRSLLPAGLRQVDGVFERGDPVTIETEDGVSVGAALSSYSAADARKIAGLKSAQLEAVLGFPARSALAHRDQMALWPSKTARRGPAEDDDYDG